LKNLENTLIEWEKIFNFICETGQINSLNNYSYYFLKKLNNLIPFFAANFFLFDEQEKIMGEPICFNINQKQLNLYSNYYYKLDNIRQLVFNQPGATKSTDLLDYTTWSKSEYFTDFLAKNNLYYSAGIDIHYQNRLLGTISLFRERSEPDFSLKDLIYLELIAKHAANQVYKLFLLNNIKQKKELKTKLIMKKISQEFELTEREKEVLNLLLAGQSNQKIAKELFISINTVKKHLSNIYQKAKVKSRTELTALVFKSKINNS
jgi:DNA-binding CsgD family transcriptional regulator